MARKACRPRWGTTHMNTGCLLMMSDFIWKRSVGREAGHRLKGESPGISRLGGGAGAEAALRAFWVAGKSERTLAASVNVGKRIFNSAWTEDDGLGDYGAGEKAVSGRREQMQRFADGNPSRSRVAQGGGVNEHASTGWLLTSCWVLVPTCSGASMVEAAWCWPKPWPRPSEARLIGRLVCATSPRSGHCPYPRAAALSTPMLRQHGLLLSARLAPVVWIVAFLWHRSRVTTLTATLTAAS